MLQAVEQQPSASRPNILVIVSDNQGWGDIGYNNPQILTPHLDALAQTGIRFDHFYVYAMCSPTRAALLSGRAPSRYDINGAIGNRSRQSLPVDTVTLADCLHEAGYETAISGKWHLGLRPEVGPLQYGFDETYGFLHGQIDKLTHHYKNGDRSWHRNDKFIDEEGHSLDLITANAVRFVKQQRDKPFFLYVPYGAPHPPLQETDRWTKPYDNVIADPSRRLYAAAVSHMDAAVGTLIEALEASDQRKNTLVVYFSDNGAIQNWPPQVKNYEGRFGPYPTLGDNGKLRGWIGDLYDGCVRTPAIVNWPGVLKPAIVDDVVSALDWYPTLAAVAGGRTSQELRLEGRNIWPRLTTKAKLAPTVLYWKSYNGKKGAVRAGDWKLVVDYDKDESELFNMRSDPNEQTNLASTHPADVTRLRQLLAQQASLDND